MWRTNPGVIRLEEISLIGAAVNNSSYQQPGRLDK